MALNGRQCEKVKALENRDEKDDSADPHHGDEFLIFIALWPEPVRNEAVDNCDGQR